MDAIGGQRRFLVPGTVFLVVLALLLALSGTFAELDIEGDQAGFLSIAAVLAGGIAGYPLGLILYIPFGLVWRYPIGDYNHFIPSQELCRKFLALTEQHPEASTALGAFRTQARKGVDDPGTARRFMGFLYERYTPEAADRPPRGRWETMHTMGGMWSAIFFGVGLSPLAVLAAEHGTPWWDDTALLIGVAVAAFLVLSFLAIHFVIIGREAGKMETQWAEWWLDLVRRRPEILEAAPVGDRFREWALSPDR